MSAMYWVIIMLVLIVIEDCDAGTDDDLVRRRLSGSVCHIRGGRQRCCR